MIAGAGVACSRCDTAPCRCTTRYCDVCGDERKTQLEYPSTCRKNGCKGTLRSATEGGKPKVNGHKVEKISPHAAGAIPPVVDLPTLHADHVGTCTAGCRERFLAAVDKRVNELTQAGFVTEASLWIKFRDQISGVFAPASAQSVRTAQ